MIIKKIYYVIKKRIGKGEENNHDSNDNISPEEEEDEDSERNVSSGITSIKNKLKI